MFKEVTNIYPGTDSDGCTAKSGGLIKGMQRADTTDPLSGTFPHYRAPLAPLGLRLADSQVPEMKSSALAVPKSGLQISSLA